MESVVLHLPVPPSVNKLRRINWQLQVHVKQWHAKCDALLLATKYQPARLQKFELHITFSDEHCKLDLDNGLKALIDYLRRIEVIVDDAKKNMRRLVVEWGDAPEGVRVSVRPWISG